MPKHSAVVGTGAAQPRKIPGAAQLIADPSKAIREGPGPAETKQRSPRMPDTPNQGTGLSSQGLPLESGVRVPSASYLQAASDPCRTIVPSVFRKYPPLLVLDLNGALLYRNKNRRNASSRPQIRPYLASFMTYIFGTLAAPSGPLRRWEVCVWSSAQPHNVKSMCAAAGFQVPSSSDPGDKALANGLAKMALNEQILQAPKNEPLLVWTRAEMDLSRRDFHRKVQTVKDLSKLWSKLSSVHPWSSRDTLLIDDSALKAGLQPFNHIPISEFTGRPDTTLLSVIDVLEAIATQDNFANWVKEGNLAKLDFNSVKSVERGRLICQRLGIPTTPPPKLQGRPRQAPRDRKNGSNAPA